MHRARSRLTAIFPPPSTMEVSDVRTLTLIILLLTTSGCTAALKEENNHLQSKVAALESRMARLSEENAELKLQIKDAEVIQIDEHQGTKQQQLAPPRPPRVCRSAHAWARP